MTSFFLPISKRQKILKPRQKAQKKGPIVKFYPYNTEVCIPIYIHAYIHTYIYICVYIDTHTQVSRLQFALGFVTHNLGNRSFNKLIRGRDVVGGRGRSRCRHLGLEGFFLWFRFGAIFSPRGF